MDTLCYNPWAGETLGVYVCVWGGGRCHQVPVNMQDDLPRSTLTTRYRLCAQDSPTGVPVTLKVDPHGFYLYMVDQNKVRPEGPAAPGSTGAVFLWARARGEEGDRLPPAGRGDHWNGEDRGHYTAELLETSLLLRVGVGCIGVHFGAQLNLLDV